MNKIIEWQNLLLIIKIETSQLFPKCDSNTSSTSQWRLSVEETRIYFVCVWILQIINQCGMVYTMEGRNIVLFSLIMVKGGFGIDIIFWNLQSIRKKKPRREKSHRKRRRNRQLLIKCCWQAKPKQVNEVK